MKLPGRRRAGPSHLRCSLLETTRKEESRSLSSQMFITYQKEQVPGNYQEESRSLSSQMFIT